MARYSRTRSAEFAARMPPDRARWPLPWCLYEWSLGKSSGLVSRRNFDGLALFRTFNCREYHGKTLDVVPPHRLWNPACANGCRKFAYKSEMTVDAIFGHCIRYPNGDRL